MPAESHHPPVSTVTRAVVWNQALWTAGYALTTGGFFNYFAKELGAGERMMALLLVIPETVGILALSTRPLLRRLGSRKRIWIGFSLAARLVSIGIPLLAFANLRTSGIDSLWVLAGLLALSQGINAIAYIAMISWLADLVPERRWGMFFARQQIAEFSILLVMPVLGGAIVDRWKQHSSPNESLLIYVVMFSVGIMLLLLSMLPLLRLPEVPLCENTAGVLLPKWNTVAESLRNRSLRYLLIHNWWLAAANGLTQSAFFLYLSGPLGLQLATYQLLSAVTKIVGIPASLWTGWFVDRHGNQRLMIIGVLLAGGAAMIFWLLATPAQWWWVFGAYVLWGFWPAVNIPGRNLVLKLSPESDNTTQLALFRNVGGLIAGLSGLVGGFLLAEWKPLDFPVAGTGLRLDAYHVLFLISFAGRVTSVLWLLFIQEPRLPIGRVLNAETRSK